MVDISKINDKLSPVQKQQDNKTKSVDSDLFKQTFDKAMGEAQAEKTPASTNVNPLGEIRATHYVEPATGIAIDQQTQSLLQKLDTYGQKLSNPDVTLREVEPLIKEIRDDATELSLAASKSNGSDQGLKKIADESAVFATVEYFKFMRGDYI